MTARGLVVAAVRSGSGKTTVMLGMLAALRRRGMAVRAAKAGPDYIDPAFHAAATGAPGVNLDSWAMPPGLLDALAADAGRSAELLVVEGVMGLFDGVKDYSAPKTRVNALSADRTGSTADLAKHLCLPVLLVLDVSGQSQTAAAVARGLALHDPGVRISGIVLNHVRSERHRVPVLEAIEAVGIPVVGAVPRDAAWALAERHLGLVQAQEHRDLAARLDGLAAMAERHLDLDRIAAMATPLSPAAGNRGSALRPPGQRIAIASDAAFTFMYPHLRDGWRHAGAEIVTFSPLADEPPPDHCDVCWLPGGYPELYAGALANAHRFKEGLRRFGATRPVHGECGGYMVLGEGLQDANGTPHAMAGLLGHVTSFAARKLHLGYRQARLIADGALGRAGTIIRGHEFHYASLLSPGADRSFLEMTDARGQPVAAAGGRRGHVSGTFFHAIAQAVCD
jgi:cobyrinic acid a,c-diamide synthase